MKVQGRVKWFNAEKGFGFIDRGEGKDIFVHYSQIVQNGYKTLNEGELVEFELYQSERGMQAKHVGKNLEKPSRFLFYVYTIKFYF